MKMAHQVSENNVELTWEDAKRARIAEIERWFVECERSHRFWVREYSDTGSGFAEKMMSAMCNCMWAAHNFKKILNDHNTVCSPKISIAFPNEVPP